jgi:hypothetical protein
MIPKRLHYVWVGGRLPDKQRAFIDTWRTTNPDYEIVAWNEDNIDMKLPAIARAYARRRWATVADFARLIAVHEQGGIYLDTDFQVRRPLDSLLQHRCFLTFQHQHHPTDWICNGAFGAVPGHPFVATALQEALRLWPLPSWLDRPTRYGPKLFTRLARRQGLQRYSADGVMLNDIFVCPTHYFFPYAYGEAFREELVTPATFGVHFWEGSWQQNLPAPVRWAQSLRRRLPPLQRRPADSHS